MVYGGVLTMGSFYMHEEQIKTLVFLPTFLQTPTQILSLVYYHRNTFDLLRSYGIATTSSCFKGFVGNGFNLNFWSDI